ncbi:MAG: hypothetical protein PW786_07315 [Arachidicoccus sp.]|nr:hypothetical protein [Arachidicoccus sp.]
MRNIITLCFLFFTIISFAQKPKNGTHVFKYFDTEYHKFCGKCKVIIKEDSLIKVISLEDCHTFKGAVICNGTFRKTDDVNIWTIRDENQYNENEDCECLSIDFKKKIFYTY